MIKSIPFKKYCLLPRPPHFEIIKKERNIFFIHAPTHIHLHFQLQQKVFINTKPSSLLTKVYLVHRYLRLNYIGLREHLTRLYLKSYQLPTL